MNIMVFRVSLCVTAVILCTCLVDGANILAITTLLSPSHHLFNDVYLFELVKSGHNVTLLGHDEDRHGHPNYTHIVMEGVYTKIGKDFDLVKMSEFSEWQTITSAIFDYADATCLSDFQTKGLQTIKNYPDNFKFDLIIWDINGGRCLLPLVEKFGSPPIIGLNAFVNQPNVFRNVWQSYIPFCSHPFTDRMTLYQKLKTTFYNFLLEATKTFIFFPRQEKLAESYFGVKIDLNIIERNVSLLLTNHNPVFNYVEALPPNIVPIGGLHIQPKPLPRDLKNILDKSKHGVILFSLGSNVKSKDLGTEKIQAITRTFAKLKQTIIWKFEDNLDVPHNVYLRKWVPQNDILGHENTILFISHCGHLSSHEAVYNGVPVVGIPFYLDQTQNIKNFAAKGAGEKLDFRDLVEDKFLDVLQKVINNRTYHDKIKKLSVLYKHQMNTPLETAVYWTEYILKFKTAEHLNLATRDMNFVEFINLDVILIFLCPLLLLTTVSVVAVLKCLRHKSNKKFKMS